MTSMTEEQMRILFNQLIEYRDKAFPRRTHDWKDRYCGTCVRIYHNEYVLDCHFFPNYDSKGNEPTWDLSISVEYQNALNHLTDKSYHFKEHTEDIFLTIDKLLGIMLQMPNFKALIKEKFNELLAKGGQN